MSALDDDTRDRLNATLDDLARLAHKMNNPLTSLLGRAQLIQLGAGNDDKVRHAASVIEESAGRVAGHVRELAHLVRDARELLAGASEPLVDEAVEEAPLS